MGRYYPTSLLPPPNSPASAILVNRRSFLIVASAASALAVTTAAGIHLSSWVNQTPSSPFHALSHDEAILLNAIGETFFPTPKYPTPDTVQLAARFDLYLSSVSDDSRQGLKLLLHVIGDLARTQNLSTSPFQNLSLPQRIDALKGWENSSILERRSLMQAIKLLVSLVYFSHPTVMKSMNLHFTCT